MRLSGYEEIRCVKFNSVSYNQEMTEGNYVYTCKLDQSNKSFFCVEKCVLSGSILRKKKKKEIISQRERMNYFVTVSDQ